MDNLRSYCYVGQSIKSIERETQYDNALIPFAMPAHALLKS
jgi:hypothetical protein